MTYVSSDFRHLVQPDRVHKSVYTDREIFELEMRRIHGRVWVFLGHESQVAEPGQFFQTWIGRQQVIMTRHTDGSVRVLQNRCGHRGARVIAERCGKTRFFRCPYHGWTFKTDGSLLSVPLKDGYEGTGIDFSDPQYGMLSVPRVGLYRGWVFGSMAADGPSLEEWLGPIKSSLDDFCDRAPMDEVEVAGAPFRVIQHNNWKCFMENLNDIMHATVTHESSVVAGREQAKDLPEGMTPPQWFKYVILNGEPFEFWQKLHVETMANGHSFMGGIFPAKTSTDPVWNDYVAAMEAHHGAERAREILAFERHNTIIYPNVSFQSTYQQVRVIHPVDVDRTMVEIWNFRLKGAPESFYRTRTLAYTNVVNSPSSIVMPDDIDVYNRVQVGLDNSQAEWVSMHRDFGRDQPGGKSAIGTSELPFRNQYLAWLDAMAAEG